ncbi:hypothetical protein M7I_7647 [Glarea lozoyensis 74030]|uniref:Uncharacterized protein n=1 Tax=Glarea lozoyensis (strain ATCC 74030 / MF5533) TaxID=1104152 RepID=H0EXV7_GLAL7|nr:hypothetical protein M7I_7647 [Glarea lozoyensis 74030]
MIETVPPESVLSDVIAPYEVKPSGIQLTLLAGGSQIKFSGDIRVRTTSRTVSSVSITYKDRNGGTGGTITTTLAGTANGFDDSFAFYSFNKTFPATSSISSFTVSVAESGGLTTTFSNNGAGFPVQDSVIVLLPQSCSTNRNLQITAAVRTGTPAPTLTLTQKIPRAGGIPVPALSTSTATMTKGVTLKYFEFFGQYFFLEYCFKFEYHEVLQHVNYLECYYSIDEYSEHEFYHLDLYNEQFEHKL